MDTLSTYAKHFMGILEKPDVESITGLSPIIAIEQKTTGSNPRSTVGTITEIYDFLRLLYAKASKAYSPETGAEMVRYSDEQIVSNPSLTRVLPMEVAETVLPMLSARNIISFRSSRESVMVR